MLIEHSRCTCRWAEPRLLAESEAWLEPWAHRWCCLLRTGECEVSEEECRHCIRWEPFGGFEPTEQRREP